MPFFEFKMTKNKRKLRKLTKADNAVSKYAKSHKAMNKRHHKKFRKLLKKRAAAMSNATGIKIHSLFD